jgi:hypothetical protein
MCAKSGSSFVATWSRSPGSGTSTSSTTDVGDRLSTTMRSDR